MKQSTNLNTGALSNAIKDAIRTEYNLVAKPKLTFDWNLNRYFNPVATHTPTEDLSGFDIERFPIESIVEPLRPTKGIAKAKINEAVVSAGYIDQNSPRFYVSDTDDVYKYWTSQAPTNSSGSFASPARPRITYPSPVKANKIVIKLENTWATPKSYSVRVSATSTGTPVIVGGSNPVIDAATGVLTLWYNGSSWVSTKPATPVTTSVGIVELYVTSMGAGKTRDGQTMSYRSAYGWDSWTATTGANSSLNVIAIETHFVQDMTDRLMTVSDDFNIGDASQLYPIGTITTNVGTVVLANEDGVFNPENPDNNNVFKDLTEPNVKVNLEYIYTISGVEHSVPQFEMYASSWSNSEGQTTIELEDYSKYLKEIKPNAWMVENKTSTEIVWRVLDSVGYVDYEIQDEDLTDNTIIPVFWTDGEKTVWEILDELAQATQTAVYIDSTGKVQVRTRESAFRDSAAIDWNLLGEQRGNSLPDIVSWTPGSEYEANKIEVKFKPTKWKVNPQGKPAMSIVWEPDSETLVVRASPIIHPITNISTHMFIAQKEIDVWPFISKVQIDGEIIQYEGKQFIYYTYNQTVSGGVPSYSGGQPNYVNVASYDEYVKLNNLTPQRFRHLNRFTGGLKITERGVWNTEKKDHVVDINNWSTKMERNGNVQHDLAGMRHDKGSSTLIITTPNAMNDVAHTFWAFRGGSQQSSYKSYGTRIKFLKAANNTTQIAGLCYQLDGSSKESGYYVEIRASRNLTDAERSISNEVTIYSRNGSTNTVIGQGVPIGIAQDYWYDVDIYHSDSNRITVYINGQLAASGQGGGHPASGKFGFFARGHTQVEFEYIYAIARPIKEPADDFGFFDLKYGGIRGNQWQNEHVWETRSRRTRITKKRWTKEQYKHNLYVFDEFSPYLHEVREFDVKFDPAPVQSSYIFNTNEWFSVVPEYVSTPFGAKFIVANSGRINAVIKGEDNIVYVGSQAAVAQQCVVLGQALEFSEEETVTRNNLPAQRARGLIESELSSEWIQTKGMARSIANWMSEHWSDSVDEAEVEIFGNPLLEIGDIVDIDYARENMTPSTHKYFVVAAANSFDNGIKTTLTLRRRRIATTIS